MTNVANLDREQIALIVSRFKAVPHERCNLATRAVWNAALDTADMILAALTPASASIPADVERPLPELLSDAEARSLLTDAENMWRDLQASNLGGFSGVNRPFWILHAFKQVIEQYGKRDVGLKWSKNDLDAALAAAPAPTDSGASS